MAGRKKLPYTKCAVDGCETLNNRRIKDVYYCEHHQYRIYTFGEPEPAKLQAPSNTGLFTCRLCGIKKHISSFEKSKNGRFGINPTCKNCMNRKRNIYRKNKRKSDPSFLQKDRLRNRVKRINRCARVKKNGRTHTPADIQLLFDNQKGKCVCCRKSIKNKYHIDHVIPLALGGGSEKENLQLLCPTCNIQKSVKHPIGFMQEKGFLI